jgi:hypothetical protein
MNIIIYKLKIDSWNTAWCKLVEADRYFIGSYCLHHKGDFTHRPDDRDSMHLWNVGLLKRDYKALYPRKLSSSSY